MMHLYSLAIYGENIEIENIETVELIVLLSLSFLN